MTHQLKKILLFTCIVLASIYLIEYAIDLSYKKRVHFKYNWLLKHEIDREVMIFGSSVAYHQFDPVIIRNTIGRSVYNMGWDGIFFVQYQGLMKELLTYTTKCKYVVIACDFDNLWKNKYITRPDLFYAHLSNKYVYEALHEMEPEKIFRAKYIPGYKLTLLNKNFYQEIFYAWPNDTSINNMVYFPSDKSWDPMNDVKPFYAKCDPEIYASMKQVIASYTKKGIKVILVIPPINKEGYNKVKNPDFIKNKYRALTSSDVFFFDYTTDSLCKSRKYFHNYSHLNKEGANIFSHTFANDLNKVISKKTTMTGPNDSH